MSAPELLPEGICTPEQAAVFDFEAWAHTPGKWEPPTNAEWYRVVNPVLVSARIAWHCMFKSREQLGEEMLAMFEHKNADDSEGGVAEALLQGIRDAIAFIEPMRAVLHQAQARMLVAASAAPVAKAAADEVGS